MLRLMEYSFNGLLATSRVMLWTYAVPCLLPCKHSYFISKWNPALTSCRLCGRLLWGGPTTAAPLAVHYHDQAAAHRTVLCCHALPGQLCLPGTVRCAGMGVQAPCLVLPEASLGTDYVSLSGLQSLGTAPLALFTTVLRAAAVRGIGCVG